MSSCIVLSTRARKDVNIEDVKIRVCLFAFDCLYLNDVSMINQPLDQRRKALRESFELTKTKFEFATSLDIDPKYALRCFDLIIRNKKDQVDGIDKDIEEFLNEAVSGGTEGLMVRHLALLVVSESCLGQVNGCYL